MNSGNTGRVSTSSKRRKMPCLPAYSSELSSLSPSFCFICRRGHDEGQRLVTAASLQICLRELSEGTCAWLHVHPFLSFPFLSLLAFLPLAFSPIFDQAVCLSFIPPSIHSLFLGLSFLPFPFHFPVFSPVFSSL